MPNKRTYFYKMWHQLIQTQPKSVRLTLYEAILEYAFNGTEPTLPPKQKQIFDLAKHMIDVSQKRREIQLNRKDFARPLPDLCPTSAKANAEPEADLFEASAGPLLEHRSGEKEKNKKVSPASTPFKNQENKEGDSAHADTDAHTEKRDPEFEELMPEHLREDEAFRVEWRAWLQYRRSKKKPVSKEAAKIQLKKLGECPPNAVCSIIENSIANDWQGLFPDRPYTKPNQQQKDYTGL